VSAPSIERALEEGWSMVLEGVHLVPGMLPPIDGRLVVQCVLAIEDEEEHSTHFMVRDAGLDGHRPHRSTSTGSTTSGACRTTSSAGRRHRVR
jgi:2-phosphoglycerate kinase